MDRVESAYSVDKHILFYLFRLASLFLIVGGLIHVFIQFIHPEEELTAVSSNQWFIVALLTSLIGILNFLGILGIYVRFLKQFEVTGTLGMIFFEMFWVFTIIFSFIEAFILPLFVTSSPIFVEELLHLIRFGESAFDFGSLTLAVRGAKAMYVLGALLFGVSGYIAELPHKNAYGLLAVFSLLSIGPRLAGTSYYRFFAVPMGVVLVWLGISLWQNSQRPESEA